MQSRCVTPGTMTEKITQADDHVPAIPPLFRLQWEDVQQSYVLLFPEGMIKLNRSGGEILRRCDGKSTQGALIAELNSAFGQDVGADVRAFLTLATEKGWVTWRAAEPPA